MTEKSSFAPSIPIDQNRLSDAERVLLKEGYVCILAFTLSDPDLDTFVLVRARDRIDRHTHDKVAFFMQNEGGCRVWALAVQETITPPPPHGDNEQADHHHEGEDGDPQPLPGVVTSTVPMPETTPQAQALNTFVSEAYPRSIPPSLPPSTQEGSESLSHPPSSAPPPLPSSRLPADGRTIPSDPPTPSMTPTGEAINGCWQEVGLPDRPEGENEPT